MRAGTNPTLVLAIALATAVGCALSPVAGLAAGFVMFPSVPASTGEKPQSKLWYHDGSYWAIVQGPDGVAFYEKVGNAWQRGTFANAVIQASGNADVKWNGTDLFVLVYTLTAPRLYKYTYLPSTRAWALVTGFPISLPNPTDSETMVLEQDSSGRLWATAEGGGNANVYYSTSADHRTWSSTPVILRSGLNADDISSVVAFGGNKVGVFWSDQSRWEFGFRFHNDADPPTTWSAVEVVLSGSGLSDDHVSLAADSQGRVYAITKDASDRMRVHRRAASGTWTTKTDVLAGTGTRGIIQVAEQDAKVYILYTRWGVSPFRIEYRVADIEALTFAGETIFISASADMNNVSGMKQPLPRGSLIAVAENSSSAYWNGFGAPPPGAPQNLTATLLGSPTRVNLAWTAPAGGAPAGYNVYRQVNGGAFAKLNAGLVTALTFTDSSPTADAQLCYQATAVVASGLESAASNRPCVDTHTAPPPPPPADTTLEKRVVASADDAEESSSGSVSLTSSDLELMIDGTPHHAVGLRFTALAIPQGATVTSAYVQFVADEAQSEATSLTIRGEAADNAPAFTTASGGLMALLGNATPASVSWPNLAAWTAGAAGAAQRTPELAGVIQQIVDRPGWRSGNALALLITGTGHRTAVAVDGTAASAPLLHIEYNTGPPNTAPVVNAGPDQAIMLPSDVALDGTVTDDGQPHPPSLLTSWSKAGGPGTVTFDNALAVDTRASFGAAGSYQLVLSASDGELSTRDTVVIVALPPPNETPVVDAGPDLSITLPNDVALDGTVVDDGQPLPPRIVTLWRQLVGQGTVTFVDAHALDTRASFSAPGTYHLTLTASDGELSTRDTVEIVVHPVPPPPPVVATVEKRVAASADDAEEESTGNVNLGSSDLEMVIDGTPHHAVGLRFTALAIPQGATITRAYLQFVADEAQSEPTSLAIRGEAVDNASAFVAATGHLSARLANATAASVSWPALAAWIVGAAGAEQRTPELASVIQQIVDRAGWQSGNALALFVTGSGHRTAVAFDGTAASAALLHIEYSTAPPNLAPVVTAGPDRTITLPGDVLLDGTVTDDGQPQPPALGTAWSKLAGPGAVTFAYSQMVDTRASFGAPGSYLLQLSANDGALTTRDTVAVNVLPAPPTPPPVVSTDDPDGVEPSPIGGAGVGGTAAAVTPVPALRPGVAPNPLRQRGMLTFHTHHAGPVRVGLYDVHGRRVSVALDHPHLPAGAHSIQLEAHASLAAGMYFYRVEEGSKRVVTGRFLVAR